MMMFRLRLDLVMSAGGRNQFLNTAIVREVTSRRDHLLAHTPTSSVAVASVYWEQCLRLLRQSKVAVFALCCLLTVTIVSHVLLPVLPFTWLLFLHWMSFWTFACRRLLKRLRFLFVFVLFFVFFGVGRGWGGGRDRVDVGWLSFRTLWLELGWVWGRMGPEMAIFKIGKATMTNHFSADGTLSFCFLVGAGQHQEVERKP